MAWLYDGGSLGGRTREIFLSAMQGEGMAIDSGFHGFVKRPGSRCRKAGDLAVSARAAESTVLLHHPILLRPREELQRVVEALEKIEANWQE
jgi:hypothetical protein